MKMNNPYQLQEQKSGPHPVMIIGIIVFVLPFFNFFLPFTLPTWFGIIGLVLIMLGAVLSIFSN